MAVKSGEILEAGYSNSYGYYVKYRTYDKYDVLYAHLNSIKVKKGENITERMIFYVQTQKYIL